MKNVKKAGPAVQDKAFGEESVKEDDGWCEHDRSTEPVGKTEVERRRRDVRCHMMRLQNGIAVLGGKPMGKGFTVVVKNKGRKHACLAWNFEFLGVAVGNVTTSFSPE